MRTIIAWVEGRFKEFTGVISYDEKDIRKSSADFSGKGKDDYMLCGDLTIKGVTKPVALPFTITGAVITGAVIDPWGNSRFGIEAQTKINRRQFGINYARTLANGGSVVADEVTINLHLEAVKPDK